MIKQLSFAEQCMVRFVCALALLLVGIAHKPPVAGDHVIPASEIAQYMLPDGTVPVLCHAAEDGGVKQEKHDLVSGCEVCRLAASVVLPTQADVFGDPIPRAIERFAHIRVVVFHRQILPPNASPRGPPSRAVA